MASMNRPPHPGPLPRGEREYCYDDPFPQGEREYCYDYPLHRGERGYCYDDPFLEGRGDNITVCHLYPGFSREGRGDIVAPKQGFRGSIDRKGFGYEGSGDNF